MNRTWARIVIGIALLLTATSVAAVGLASAGPPRIELSETDLDLGQTSATQKAAHVFQVRNQGRGVLEITGISTSCGCTTAEISAHSLPSGSSADLRVVFDPQAHNGATGEFVRQVYIRSNDPETPEAVLSLRIQVVDNAIPSRELGGRP